MKNTRKKRIVRGKSQKPRIDFGKIPPQRVRVLVLILAIIFLETILVVPKLLGLNIFTGEKEIVEAYVPTKQSEFKIEMAKMVKGYPIEQMLPYISEQDKKVAALMIGIAKKESNWGVRKPVLDGEDCYNYWGFRAKTEKLGSGGHSCFDSPKEAVEAVAGRIDELVKEEKIDTPKEMVVWKCGYKCNGPEAKGAQKWISDVDIYYSKLLN